MNKLEIFDPPMCCDTGVCGVDVDPVLPQFAADIEWLRSNGAEIRRFNLAKEPAEFVSRDAVREVLTAAGNACLPLILVNGTAISRGVYPDREQLAALAGVDGPVVVSGTRRPMSVLREPSCCEPNADGTACC